MPPTLLTVVVVPVLIVMFLIIFVSKQYKRCPSNKILVVFGKMTGGHAARCIHGGGVFVIPLIQDYAYLSLEPITIDIDLVGALSKKNIRVNVPSTFTVGVSTEETIRNNAAERILGLSEDGMRSQASDIILGQLRLVIATLSIEEINQDREKFLNLINDNVNSELTKIGLEVINVNIRDITDSSGYIEAIGKKAAAEAVNIAKVEVAQAEKEGAIGEAAALREKDVQVADQIAQSDIGKKTAERQRRITVAQLEAEGVSGEASSSREQEVRVAEERAKAAQGKKNAEREQRIFVAYQEAEAVKGENESRGSIAVYNSSLQETEAEALRRANIAMANSQRDILRAEKEREVAQLERDTLAKQEVEKTRIQVAADTEAERTRRIARGEADAVMLKYEAEAEGLKKVLQAKAEGYQLLMNSCGDQKYLAPTLLMVEKLPDLIKEQVKAIQNLKIDSITVWDSPKADGESGSTANFLRSLVGSVPPLHTIAKQVGVELPQFLGSFDDPKHKTPAMTSKVSTPPMPPPSAASDI